MRAARVRAGPCSGGGGGAGGYAGGAGGVQSLFTGGRGAGGGSSYGPSGTSFGTAAAGTTPSITLTPVSPTVTTQDATAVATSSATAHGTIGNLVVPGSYHFEYGTDTSYGSSTPTQSISAPGDSVSAQLSNLTPGQTYHFQLVLTINGTDYDGGDDQFTLSDVSSTQVLCGPSPAAGTSAECTAVVVGDNGHGPNPTGDVSFSVSPSSADGALGASSCTLSSDGPGRSTCSVSFAPPGGAYSVTASYPGDQDSGGPYPASSDSTPQDVSTDWGDVQTLPFSSLSSPEAVAADGNGDVFVVTLAGGSPAVVERTPSGTERTLDFTGTPASVAADAAGDVFVVDTQGNDVLEMPAGKNSQGDEIVLPFQGLTSPIAVAADPQGDVFVADENNDDVLELPLGDNGNDQTTIQLQDGGTPAGVAVDAAGDVFAVVQESDDNEHVVEVPAGSSDGAQELTQFTPDTTLGIASDPAGDLFEVDARRGPAGAAGAAGGRLVIANPRQHRCPAVFVVRGCGCAWRRAGDGGQPGSGALAADAGGLAGALLGSERLR